MTVSLSLAAGAERREAVPALRQFDERVARACAARNTRVDLAPHRVECLAAFQLALRR